MTPILLQSLPITHLILSLLLSTLTLTFLMRIILSWYPQVNIQKGLWLLITAPTEPVLSFSRKIVAPIGGVDVTPVIWVGLISLFRELVVGQQGLLTQILNKVELLA